MKIIGTLTTWNLFWGEVKVSTPSVLFPLANSPCFFFLLTGLANLDPFPIVMKKLPSAVCSVCFEQLSPENPASSATIPSLCISVPTWVFQAARANGCLMLILPLFLPYLQTSQLIFVPSKDNRATLLSWIPVVLLFIPLRSSRLK